MDKQAQNQFYTLLTDPIFLSTFFSWFFAQFIKAFIEIGKGKATLKTKGIFLILFWKTGGMPSSHSAMTAALATSIGFMEGVKSPLFIGFLFYGILVIRDAMGVRNSAGIQAQLLNQISQEINRQWGKKYPKVKEVHGHTLAEVSVGIVLGFFIAVAFCSL